MISVQQADQIIQSHIQDYGTVAVPFSQALNHVLAENILADRDLPPYNRVAMDGIAIRYKDYHNGCRSFRIAGVLGAGEVAPTPLPENNCFEIMTGAALPPDADTIVPYEHLHIQEGLAHIKQEKIRAGQNIHPQASDKRQGTVLVASGTLIGPVEISVAASVGKSVLLVKKHPRVVVFSSGNELVDVADTPLPYQIRRSNNYAIQAVLQRYHLTATMLHLPDNLHVINQALENACAHFDVILLSGGISMGKFDYIPQALSEIGVTTQFHKVRQKPGKPFWFGTFGQKGIVFALPGNPVSTFLCLLRYTLPWLEASLNYPINPHQYAVLDSDVHFEPALQYFIQVKLVQDSQAALRAIPLKNNGSGDYASLLDADAFLELPEDQTDFKAGETYRVWRYR